MFGLGLTEILIFLVIAFIVFGIPIAIVVLLVFLLRKPQSSINDYHSYHSYERERTSSTRIVCNHKQTIHDPGLMLRTMEIACIP